MDKQHQNNFKGQTAEILLKLEAIKLSPNNPFIWASGWKSPIYCDNRIILSDPFSRDLIANNFSEIIKSKYKNAELIAGVATGAIAHGVLVAQELGVPFVYVRASAKEHGRKNLIEGKVESGQSVVVIEDLVSSGKSSLAAVQALREGGFKVNGMGAIFSYGFEHAKKSFEEVNCELFTLGDYDTLIDQALETKYITKDDVEMLKVWREDPSIWNK